MNRYIKILLITFLVTGVLGALLLGLGIAFKGDFLKASELTARGPVGIHFMPQYWQVLYRDTQDIPNFARHRLQHKQDWQNYCGEHHRHQTDRNWQQSDFVKTIPAAEAKQIQKLELNLVGMESVTIQAGEEFGLYLDGDQRNLENRIKEGEWRIETKFRHSPGSLTVTIPENAQLEKVKIKLDAGVLWAENITAEKLNLEMTAGTMALYQVACEKAEVEMTAGQIQVYGDAKKQLDAEILAGSFTWTMPRPADYSYKLEKAVGTVTIGEESFEGLANEKNKIGKGGPEFHIECMAGEAQILFEDEI